MDKKDLSIHIGRRTMATNRFSFLDGKVGISKILWRISD